MFRTLRKQIRKRLFPAKGRQAKWSKTLEAQREYERVLAARRASHPHLPMVFGFKVYSQADEDGVIDHILKKAGISDPTFFECGCGDGVENNTHYLALRGGRGVWMDGDEGNILDIQEAIGGGIFEKKLWVRQGLMTPETVVDHLDQVCRFLDVQQIDVFSLDIDTLEFYLLERMIESQHRPKLVVVEYNAKFPPDFAITRANSNEGWESDDYMGASLACFVDLLGDDYVLVSCSAPGTNAFFVTRSLAHKFENYSIFDIYQPPAYWLADIQPAHRPTMKYLRDKLAAG